MAKEQKSTMIKDAIMLCVISLVAALALSFVNEITKDIIAQRELEAKIAAYEEVFPGLDSLTDANGNEVLAKAMEEAESILLAAGHESVTINEICLVNDADGKVIGYVGSVSLKAYDAMTLAFGYSTEGVCTGIAFLSIKETPGIGMKVDLPDFKGQFVNKKADAFEAVKSASAENEINAISGATFSTNGVIRGVNAGISFVKELQNRLGGAN